ncbi:GYF domain-containing protein [Stieleria neptunia]|uniref:GYF domain-containing protein n=1 Tax=Stieleria neptunia TaxID=2527979 RepID=UPI0036F2646E
MLSGESASTWYVRPPSGGQYGPATSAMLKVWIDEGRVAKTALLWKDGWPQWREASDALPEIADSLPGSQSLDTADPFADGPSGSKLTTPIAREKTSRIHSEFAGDAKIGAVRRKRSSRRITLVAVLAALVVGLIVTLFLVASTRG